MSNLAMAEKILDFLLCFANNIHFFVFTHNAPSCLKTCRMITETNNSIILQGCMLLGATGIQKINTTCTMTPHFTI